MTPPAGKHALVTGGGTGIGAEIARALAGAGASVTIAGRRRGPLDATAASAEGLHPVVCDVTDEAALADAFSRAVAERGQLSIVIANAGAAESAPFARTSLEAFQRVIAVNLTGAFLTLREGLRAMQGAGWGRLIVVSSVAGLKGYAYVAPYCAAKHGAVGLARALAAEVAGSGITVNAVCPAYTESPMLEQAVRGIVSKTGRSEAETRGLLAGKNLLNRFILPEEVAAAVLWLCGPGSDAITGQAISVSGGETW
jgi:NAD(P)-dependent dehydrogenase (short-subunit alcohol dehydrogenase family)